MLSCLSRAAPASVCRTAGNDIDAGCSEEDDIDDDEDDIDDDEEDWDEDGDMDLFEELTAIVSARH